LDVGFVDVAVFVGFGSSSAALSFSPMALSASVGMPSLTTAVMASWMASCTRLVAR